MKFMDCFKLYSLITTYLLVFTYKCVAETWHNDKLVSYFATASQEYSRAEAEDACRDRGGRLALLKNEQTHQFVYNILPAKRVQNGVTTYHIALNRGALQCGCNGGATVSNCAACRRSWHWGDGSEMTTERWKPSFPWADENRDCGAENSWTQYISVGCNTNRGIICQYSCGSVGCHDSECSYSSPSVYRCQCESGYIGQHCDIDFNECDSEPCQNGATCINGINAFRCNCITGFTGLMCETDINECLSNPCLNGGTCRDQVNRYICFCKNGYTSYNCETDIDECACNPCLNDGSCFDLIGAYNCTCAERYSGGTCEIGFDTKDVLHEKNSNKSNSPNEAIIGLSVTLAVVTVIAVVASSLMIFFWRRSRLVVKTSEPAKLADPNMPSVNSSSEPVVIYEKVQDINDDYQNAYQVLSS